MNRTSLRNLVATGIATMALTVAAVGIAAPAGAADASGARHRRVHLTADQKQCLSDHGITRPIRPLTPEKVTALKAAAQACDIKLPKRLGHRLTADQKQCLSDHGITRPIRPLTPEKVTALKAAAQACGITRPGAPTASAGTPN
jgi:mRNA-degrading endonuclease toxin of MazEF toxin-antitoxin module